MKGRIYSIESFGAVDGPGIRLVVFFHGCPMRCAYCHNPDTWASDQFSEMTVEEILQKFERNQCFYESGGITATGGEPLLQLDFLIALFTVFKEQGIHTCLDTSGICFDPGKADMDKYKKLAAVTDLCMLDIKETDPVKHKKLTGQDNRNILAFARFMDEQGVKLWVRHVLVPGITDNDNDLFELGKFLATLKNLETLDVLPYHTMGVPKYERLGLEYPLKDIPAADKELVLVKKAQIMKGFSFQS